MEQMEQYDVVVIGGGPGGLAAAAAACESGAGRVAVLERDGRAGGILNQCIHDGFGIVRYGLQLSGPEYAERECGRAVQAGAAVQTGEAVLEISSDRIVTALGPNGLRRIRAGAVVLATGCRERTRGALSIPGTRPAGIFTAGTAQNLINLQNVMIGRRIVILGSGDIGLIMARRLTLEGAEVLGAAEIMDEPQGLARNVSQCLDDFGIPLHLGRTVSNIFGRHRLEAVEISRVDENRRIIAGSGRIIPCDTLVLSVGLIPENEVAETAGVSLDRRTNGALTDRFLQTSVPGIFACGNARAVMDLADFVSEQGELAGANAARYTLGEALQPWQKNPHNAARKGMPEQGSITCTLCPRGCQVQIRADGTVTGNGCPKGAELARQEREEPRRILTTTMRISAADSRLLPVRSDRPVPLREMRRIAAELRETTVAEALAGHTAGQGAAAPGEPAVAPGEPAAAPGEPAAAPERIRTGAVIVPGVYGDIGMIAERPL